jgi:hypothetical protein
MEHDDDKNKACRVYVSCFVDYLITIYQLHTLFSADLDTRTIRGAT